MYKDGVCESWSKKSEKKGEKTVPRFMSKETISLATALELKALSHSRSNKVRVLKENIIASRTIHMEYFQW